MGYDYAIVHLVYTIPPAILLSVLYAPLCTKLDIYKIGFLITIAVTATIPWDSYLIRTNVWSYPPNVIIGPTLLDIPLEEVFFFVIQTFDTTLLYLLLNKPVLAEQYLVKESKGDKWKYVKIAGQLVLALGLRNAFAWVRAGGQQTYLGLILVWALPFLLLTWSLGYQLLVNLPATSTLTPILLPTLYLWIVDTLALKRGTWVIEHGTKTGYELWPGLEVEEAIFFLLTNTLIVAGLVAFDNAVSVLNLFPAHFPRVPTLPSPALLVRALLLPAAAYDQDRIQGLQQSVKRLQAKSRSFYLASGTFEGRLRIDLVILYSFCRVADDLIDNAKDIKEAKDWVEKLKTYLDLCYGEAQKDKDGNIIQARDPNQGRATLFIMHQFPPETHLTLLLLPTSRLGQEPLYELLKGFEMDLQFPAPASTGKPAGDLSGPIRTEADLDQYGARVAGTVALLCIQLVLYHYPGVSGRKSKQVMLAGHKMGIALQYTNIARDLAVDASIGRCYVPIGWLKKEKATAESFVAALNKRDDDSFMSKKIEAIRSRLLDRAFSFYEASVGAIEELPVQARAPMRVAVESYMQIGRELRQPGYKVKNGRATVPIWKRLAVAYRTLQGPRSKR